MIDRVSTEESKEANRDTDILLQHLKLKRKIGKSTLVISNSQFLVVLNLISCNIFTLALHYFDQEYEVGKPVLYQAVCT